MPITLHTMTVSALLTAALALCAVLLPAGEMASVHELRENLTEDVETLRYGEKNLPEGDLYQASALQSAEGELLTVETQQAKAFYLRGFVGSVYRDGCWEPLPDSALGGDNAGMLQWLAAQGFDPLTQSALYWQLDGDAPEANTMHIRVQDASLGWNTAALDEKIAACFMDVEPGEYTRVCRLIERTIYGGDAPDLREERAMQSFLFKLAASAREEPLHTRLRLRYTCP